MGCKTNKKRSNKEKHCISNENKQDGSMENRTKI